jgi:hypothetical protein
VRGIWGGQTGWNRPLKLDLDSSGSMHPQILAFEKVGTLSEVPACGVMGMRAFGRGPPDRGFFQLCNRDRENRLLAKLPVRYWRAIIGLRNSYFDLENRCSGCAQRRIHPIVAIKPLTRLFPSPPVRQSFIALSQTIRSVIFNSLFVPLNKERMCSDGMEVRKLRRK